ncbi:MAG: cobalamin-binding protein, partial [Flavobacteriaceae bacterium]
PYPFKEKDAIELEKITKTKTILVDGEMFSWYGSRLLKVFEYFKNLHRSL